MLRESETQTRASRQRDPKAEWRRARVLLAEDDRHMRSLLIYNLKRAGYHVTACEDGWELLTHLGSFLLAREDHEDIDVVVSDIRMPGVDGMEVLRGAEDCPGFPPMILITAFGDERTHAEAERFGAVKIFDKPFDVDALIACVRGVVPPFSRYEAGKRVDRKADGGPATGPNKHPGDKGAL